jgi:hypothetical protein
MDRAGHIIDQKECNPSWREELPGTMDNYWGPEESSMAWYKCVSDFSKRRLTQASDKLAAIAGLASKFCEIENVKYIAGLWDRDLFYGMTWRKYGPREWCEEPWLYLAATADLNLSADLFVPPSEYRAPSWSWASVNGSITWETQRSANGILWISEVRERWKMDFGPRLISCHLLHSSDNTYIDTLQGSWIEVHGYYRNLWVSKLNLSPKADGPEGPFIKSVVLDIDASQSETINAYLSQPDHSDQALKELLMLQVSISLQASMGVYAVLLEKSQEPDCFRRVGLVELEGYVIDYCGARDDLDFSSLDKCDPMTRKKYEKSTLYKSKELQKDR